MKTVKRMQLASDSSNKVITNASNYERLSAITENIFAMGVRNGMPSSWLYDCVFANVAVFLAKRAIAEKGEDSEEAAKIVASIEAVDFNVFGELGVVFNEERTKRKYAYARNVVEPLYAAYMASKEAQEYFIDAERFFVFIINEWKDPD